ncbi:hypothetical protein ACLMJK_001277 [Lecanora helva]
MAIQQPMSKAAQLTPDQTKALQIHNEGNFPFPILSPNLPPLFLLTFPRPQPLTLLPARKQATQQHGTARPALIWDAHLTSEAEKWAKHLAQLNQGLKHSTGDQRPGQGENLFWYSSGGDLAGASQGWVNEQKSYHGEKIGEGNFEAYGHYTQVIWPSTTRVGLASAKSSNGGNFIVGRYSPPGNFSGESAWSGK